MTRLAPALPALLLCLGSCHRVELALQDEDDLPGSWLVPSLPTSWLPRALAAWIEPTNVENYKEALSHAAKAGLELLSGKKNGLVVVPVESDAQSERLEFMKESCARKVKVKDLGNSADSSRSGSEFVACDAPRAGEDAKRVIAKGGIRDTTASPEWDAFKLMAPRLKERFDDFVYPSLMNKVLVGWEFDYRKWVALEDMSASDLVPKIRAVPGLNLPEEAAFEAFDVKPLGSRAPELEDLLLRLKRTPSLFDFEGWERMRYGLQRDLCFLDGYNVVDESIFVQVLGPVQVTLEDSFDRGELEKVLTGGSPRCALDFRGGGMTMTQVNREPVSVRQLTIACVSVFDYFLTLTLPKQVQNYMQCNRWTDYSGKILNLFDCLAHFKISSDCHEYREVIGVMQ